MIDGLPWADTLRDFARVCRFTAADVLDGQTWAEFYTVWCASGERRAGHNPGAVRDKINRLRAAQGLPPMKG